jgi:hypothetical protein
MQQKLSYALLVCGAGLFLYQLGDLLAVHSTWAEVRTPAGVGEILRTLGGAVLAVVGALGVRLGTGSGGNGTSTSVSSSTLKRLPVLALALTAGAGVVAGCTHAAPVLPSPSASQIEQTRRDALVIAQGTTIALGLGDQVLTVVDGLQQQGVVSADVARGVATAAHDFATWADRGLQDLQTVADRPGLLTTASVILQHLDPLLAQLDASDNQVLHVLAGSLRIATQVARALVDPTLPAPPTAALTPGGALWMFS